MERRRSDGGGTAHVLINKAFLGLLSTEDLKGLPFFQDCKAVHVSLPCFPFSCLFHGGKDPVFGCLDPLHAFKRFAFHLTTSSRCVSFGDFALEIGFLLKGGLTARAFSGADIQSDKDYARKLNSGHLTNHPLEHGCRIGMLINALLISGWSEKCPLKDSFGNCLVAYYVLLLSFRHCVKKYGSMWNRHYLPMTTFKNLLYVAAHGAMGCLHWPENVHFRPRARCESFCEFHFFTNQAAISWNGIAQRHHLWHTDATSSATSRERAVPERSQEG